MWTEEQATHALADRVGCRAGSAADRRRSLEDTLLPMVRCVLRTGQGHPRLVRWVRKALPVIVGPSPASHPVDPDRTAPRLAQLLCTALLQQMGGRASGGAALETVFGC
jgi:hypothetical protein